MRFLSLCLLAIGLPGLSPPAGDGRPRPIVPVRLQPGPALTVGVQETGPEEPLRRDHGARATGLYFPTSESWEKVTCQEAGADQAQIRAALELAARKNSKGVVILWRGKILDEQYWQGWTRDTTGPAFSASKSLVSTLVGMAIEEGRIEGTDQSAADFLT